MTPVLARVPALRLVRTRRAWVPIVGWTVIGIACAMVARSQGGANGADHVMRGAYAFLVLPLLSYGVVSATLGGKGLRRGIRGVMALGARPWSAALASIAVAIAFSAALAGVLAAVVCGLAHGIHDPPLATDLVTSLWIGALGGGAYAAYFSAGSALGNGTIGPRLLLAIDWLVGSGAGVGAVLTPRGHVHSLLGGPLCADLSQRASSALLVVLLVAYAGVALLFARRA